LKELEQFEGLLSCDLDLAPQLDELLQDPLLGEGSFPGGLEFQPDGGQSGWDHPGSRGAAFDLKNSAQPIADPPTPEAIISENCSEVSRTPDFLPAAPCGGELLAT